MYLNTKQIKAVHDMKTTIKELLHVLVDSNFRSLLHIRVARNMI